jgi:hypothetical protein
VIIARSAVASRPTNTNTAADGVATEPDIYRHDSSFDALITPHSRALPAQSIVREPRVHSEDCEISKPALGTLTLNCSIHADKRRTEWAEFLTKSRS